jgi:hypothetical protein
MRCEIGIAHAWISLSLFRSCSFVAEWCVASKGHSAMYDSGIGWREMAAREDMFATIPFDLRNVNHATANLSPNDCNAER